MNDEIQGKMVKVLSNEGILYKVHFYEDFWEEDDMETKSKFKVWESTLVFLGFLMALALATYMAKIFFMAYFNGGSILVDINRLGEATLEFYLVIVSLAIIFPGFICYFKKFVE